MLEGPVADYIMVAKTLIARADGCGTAIKAWRPSVLSRKACAAGVSGGTRKKVDPAKPHLT
jgi:hypothetical protein